MSAFEQAVASLPKLSKNAKTPAPKVLILKPEHFADSWENKPVCDVEIGIRVYSENDVRGAKLEAAKAAREAKCEDEERDEIYNDTLFYIAVARGVCNPKDVTSAHPFLELGEDIVPVAFKPATIRWIVDEIETLQVEQSPLFKEATGEELEKLSDYLLDDDPFEHVERLAAARARRYLKLALDIIEQ